MAERTIPPRPTALDDEFDRLTVDTNTLVANLSGYADKVGIGTVSPARSLDVVNTDGQPQGRFSYNAGNYLEIGCEDISGVGIIKASGGRLVLDPTITQVGGSLGIGVADPDHELELAGVLHVSNEVASPSAPSSGDGGCVYVKSDGKLYYISDTVAETDLSSGGGSGTVTSITPAADSGSGSAITSAGTFTYTGGTNVSTSVTGTTVTINSTDQFSGTVTSITPAADAGSGTAITTSGTLTFSGTSNEVDTSVSGTTVTVGLPTNVSVAGTLNTGDAVTAAKVVNGDFTGVTLTNNDDTAGTGAMVGIQFNLNDTDDDQNLPAGKIQIVKEQSWTDVDATHDSAMRFELAENGTQSEKMTLDSAGKLSIDGDFKVGGNDVQDSGDNNIVSSDGSGNIGIAASAKVTTFRGPTLQVQGMRQAFTSISAAGPTALDATNTWVNTNASGNQVDLTLPSAATVGGGFLLYINDFNGTGALNDIVITRDGTDTIGGATSKTISTANGHLWLISNGTDGWGVISQLLS